VALDAEQRKRLALVIGMAAHVERNTTSVFPVATTDRLEDAADELASGGAISFETATVVRRALTSLLMRNPGRLWSAELIAALQAIDE